jgi:hypothetical protein
MPEARALVRKKMRDDMTELKKAAIAELENRGYAVRGKTTAQIRKIIKRRPTLVVHKSNE